MAGLFSNLNNYSYDGIRGLYSVANGFREMGPSFSDFWCCHSALWLVSNENDLDLFSAKRQVDGI